MTKEDVKKLHDAWEKSGLTIVEFCKKNGIARHTLNNYRRRHGLSNKNYRKTDAELKKLHEKFLKSELSIDKFCNKQGISPSCLYSYRRKHGLTDPHTFKNSSPKKSNNPGRVEKLTQTRKNLQTSENTSFAHDFLTKAATHLKDRAVTYDKPEGERSMAKTVEMFNALTDSEITEEQGWKFMALLKLVRSEQGNFKADNYEDLSAYGALAGEAASKNRK